MLKAVDKILNPLVFKCIMVTMLFSMNIVFIHNAFGGYVKYALLFGILICFWMLIKGNLFPDIVNDKVVVSLLGFSLSYFVTIILNRQYAPIENIKKLVYFVVFVLLLVFFQNKLSLDKVKKDMIVFSSFVVIGTFLFSLASLIIYVLGIAEWFIYYDEASGNENTLYVIGTFDRFYGLCNPNIGSAIAAVSLISSLFIISVLFDDKKKFNVFQKIIVLSIFVNAVLQYVLILLYASRGTFYSLIIATGFICFISSVKKKTKLKSIKKFIFSALLAIIVMSLMLTSASPIINIMGKVQDKVSSSQTEKTFIEEDIEKLIMSVSDNSTVSALIGFRLLDIDVSNFNMGRTDSFDTSGRMSMWIDGLKLFVTNPIFGYSREGMMSKLTEIDSEYKGLGGVHNIYITILCSSGIVGFIFYAAAMIIAFVNFFKSFIKSKDLDPYLVFSCMMTIYYLISDFFEQRTMYTAGIFTVTFWAYFGYMYYFAKAKLSED